MKKSHDLIQPSSSIPSLPSILDTAVTAPAATFNTTDVYLVQSTASQPSTPHKRGRVIEKPDAETVMMLRKVAAVKAYIAPHGSKIDDFEAVSDALNENVDFSQVLEAKSIRDTVRVFSKKLRFKRPSRCS